MILKPHENIRLVKNFCEKHIQWSGEYIGDITNLVNQIPALKGNKLFYMYPINQYVILKKYEIVDHLIELIKYIFEMNIIPYNFCKYKKKTYIMYLYEPFKEFEINYAKTKKTEITDDHRKIYFLHWILGVKGKTLKIYSDEHFTFFSTSKYSKINYERNDMTKSAINKFFSNYQNLYQTSLFFKNQEKIDKIRNLMSADNYWWFQEIEKRIEQIVPSNSYT